MENRVLSDNSITSYVQLVSQCYSTPSERFLHTQIIQQCLSAIFPQYYMEDDWKRIIDDVDGHVPCLQWRMHGKNFPTSISFYLLCRFRQNCFKFFYDMITRWLLPGTSTNADLFYAFDFTFADDDTVFSVENIALQIEDQEELNILLKNFATVQTEIKLGVASEYYARTILGIKGLSTDDKTSAIHEHIVNLLNHRPHDFDYDIFSEMQHVLLLCHDEFKQIRRARHISKIISAHYLYRRAIRSALQQHPETRNLHVKCMKSTLYYPQGKTKSVIGIIVAMNFLEENEIFEKRHLLRTITSQFSDIKPIKHSFFSNISRSDFITTLYIEIEKTDGTDFTMEEMQKLRKNLPKNMCNRIEYVTHPIFMPANEEEIMRNIVTLSNQLCYVRDMPQVIISFSEQKRTTLSFLIILTRIVRPDSNSIHDLFLESDTFLKFIPDRTKNVGMLRKKHPKECTVFRVEVEKTDFLRSDNSLDLTKARQTIASELSRIVGDFRDYNGGIISKQHEILFALKKSLLQTVGKQNELLLENFFYSLTPAIAQTVADIPSLKTLFLMLCEAIETHFFKGYTPEARVRESGSTLFAIIMTNEDSVLRDRLHIAFETITSSSLQLISSHINSSGISYLGYIFRSEDIDKKREFIGLLNQTTVE